MNNQIHNSVRELAGFALRVSLVILVGTYYAIIGLVGVMIIFQFIAAKLSQSHFVDVSDDIFLLKLPVSLLFGALPIGCLGAAWAVRKLLAREFRIRPKARD